MRRFIALRYTTEPLENLNFDKNAMNQVVLEAIEFSNSDFDGEVVEGRLLDGRYYRKSKFYNRVIRFKTLATAIADADLEIINVCKFARFVYFAHGTTVNDIVIYVQVAVKKLEMEQINNNKALRSFEVELVEVIPQ